MNPFLSLYNNCHAGINLNLSIFIERCSTDVTVVSIRLSYTKIIANVAIFSR